MTKINIRVIAAALLMTIAAWPAQGDEPTASSSQKPAVEKSTGEKSTQVNVLEENAGDVKQEKDTKQKKKESVDRFAVPNGEPKDLVRYITDLITIAPPTNLEERKKLRKAILTAAEKILAAKPNDQELEFAVQAKMNMLDKSEQLTEFADELKKGGHDQCVRLVRGFTLQLEMRNAMMRGESEQMRKPVVNAVLFLEEKPPQVTDITLAYMAGLVSEMTGDSDLAVKTYTRLAKVFNASDNAKLAEFGKILEGVVRRLNLVGKEMKLEGKLLSGEAFELSKLKGKVVLVAFWASDDPSCTRDIPDLRGFYRRYHAKGFEIIGVSLDRKRANLESFVQAKNIPWPIIAGDEKPNAAVTEYGVLSLPTMVLIGKDGRVSSVNVGLETLGKELEKQLGSAEEKPHGKGK
jgi:peroxiredoxin